MGKYEAYSYQIKLGLGRRGQNVLRLEENYNASVSMRVLIFSEVLLHLGYSCQLKFQLRNHLLGVCARLTVIDSFPSGRVILPDLYRRLRM